MQRLLKQTTGRLARPKPLNLAIMNVIERQKRMLEATLGRVAGVSVEITFYKYNAISLLWDGALEQPFSRLQNYFNGKLEGEFYDTDDDFSVCYLKLG